MKRAGFGRPKLRERMTNQRKSATLARREEVSLSLGLLGWLGREADIDVRALARHPTEEDLPWFEWTGLLLAVLQQAVLDETTVKVLADAVADAKGADRKVWLDVHLRLARAAALAAIAPESAPTLLVRPSEAT